MSGFSAEWLALREPVDHRSVSTTVRDAVREWIGPRQCIDIVDLGCGSGSNLRGLAPYLAPAQRWRLVDWDLALLDHARRAISEWADDCESAADSLTVRAAEKEINVSFEQADLMQDYARVLDKPAGLVTAAAFFDLVSPAWIADFCAALAQRHLPLYTVLTYNGEEAWTPAHGKDAAVLAAFHAHQHSDKGFGPAAGPDAISALRNALEARGYTVIAGESPWQMDRADASLIAELAAGTAQAAVESGQVNESTAAEWLAARRNADTCRIGHVDLFARPS
ncbi:class I SAM-dependent methyltransferase [Roseiarcaceae bacterium H3SJ34-1]|uniref:class I SAM-dependent methyltransferase n=1 Tax=Terripilifer ovatus TaxID=3032367 RepID=UPI003AB99F0F|nr:class I SAM-dependent methyltransferase [Roseiarcaceae bacterium H3SJ34-1]